MRFFLNLSIRWKLALGFSIGVVSILLLAGTAIFAMSALRDSQTEMQEVQLSNVIDYMALDASLNQSQALLHHMLRTRDPSRRAELMQGIEATHAKNDAIMARLAQRVGQDALPLQRFKALKLAREKFNHVRDTQIIPAIDANRLAEAEAAFDLAAEHYQEVNTVVEEMAELAMADARQAVEQSIARVQRAVLALSFIGLGALLLSALAVVALNRAIADPVVRVAEEASRISVGELDRSLPGEERQDEIGTLARAFNRMSASLRELALVADHIADGDLTDQVKARSKDDRLVISFGIMSENLKGLTGEMRSGADEVSAAAMEILTLTREFLVNMVDQERAGRFQNALLRLEEVSKRLSTLVGRIKQAKGN